MLFGKLVVGEVYRFKAAAFEVFCQPWAFAFVGGQAHKHVGALCIIHAVVELGHVVRTARQIANQLHKALEAAPLFWQADGKQGLAFFPNTSTLCDKAKAIKVHIGAAQNGCKGAAFDLVLGHILLDGRHRQRACGLNNRAGVCKYVFDSGAHGVCINGDVVVDQFFRHAKCFCAHQFDGCTVRKKPHIRQRHAFPCFDRLHHRIRVVHLHTNDFDVWAHSFDVIGHASNQPAAANGHKYRVKRTCVLSQHFHGNGALTRNHIRVVKGVYKRKPLFLLKFYRVVVSVGKALAEQHHVTAQPPHGINFDLWRGGWHHDKCLCP